MLKEGADISKIKTPCPDCLLKDKRITWMRRKKNGRAYCPRCKKSHAILFVLPNED